MRNATAAQLFSLFFETVEAAHRAATTDDQEEFDYLLFEVFDTGSTSFLHENCLEILFSHNLITENQKKKSAEVREIWQNLTKNGEIELADIRRRIEPHWKFFFKSCSDLYNSLKSR